MSRDFQITGQRLPKQAQGDTIETTLYRDASGNLALAVVGADGALYTIASLNAASGELVRAPIGHIAALTGMFPVDSDGLISVKAAS